MMARLQIMAASSVIHAVEKLGCANMKLYQFNNAWMVAVANDHYSGDGQRAKRHGRYN
jgi:hypothetical protein